MTDGNVPLEFGYTNYRGEYSIRRIEVLGVHFGATEWHPEPQWLLKGFDIEKQAERDFAVKDIGIRYEAVAQSRVAAWMLECFGSEITMDKVERADRFIEEALELAQATGWTPDRAHALVDYVFSRSVGEVGQEVGGVMVTLAALCNVFDIDIATEIDREVGRITQPEMVLKIRAKQASKPVGSALPVPSLARAEANDIALGLLDKIDQINSAEWFGGDVQRRAAIQCAIRDAIEGA